MKNKGYNFRKNDAGEWVVYHDDTIICGSYKTQDDAVVSLANYVESNLLRDELSQKGIDEEKLFFKNQEELLEMKKELESRSLTPEQIENGKAYRKAADFVSFFNLFFRVRETSDGVELTISGNKHIHIVHCLRQCDGCYFEQFKDFAEKFNVDEQIDELRLIDTYRDNYTVRKSLQYFEELQKRLKEIASII